MAAADLGEMKLHRSQRGGSIGLVLLIAVVLVGAAVGLLQVGRGNAALYILILLAILGTVGVFSLFALASGILRFAGQESEGSEIRGLVDGAFDGILVTDAGGRILYANEVYLHLIGAASAKDVRPIERVFLGDPDVSEAVYRLLKAAREGRRLQEEVRVGRRDARRAGTLAAAAGPAGRASGWPRAQGPDDDLERRRRYARP
jgi:two-component system cell cycle sensor histidine kinase/response regulator CckA